MTLDLKEAAWASGELADNLERAQRTGTTDVVAGIAELENAVRVLRLEISRGGKAAGSRRLKDSRTLNSTLGLTRRSVGSAFSGSSFSTDSRRRGL